MPPNNHKTVLHFCHHDKRVLVLTEQWCALRTSTCQQQQNPGCLTIVKICRIKGNKYFRNHDYSLDIICLKYAFSDTRKIMSLLRHCVLNERIYVVKWLRYVFNDSYVLEFKGLVLEGAVYLNLHILAFLYILIKCVFFMLYIVVEFLSLHPYSFPELFHKDQISYNWSMPNTLCQKQPSLHSLYKIRVYLFLM